MQATHEMITLFSRRLKMFKRIIKRLRRRRILKATRILANRIHDADDFTSILIMGDRGVVVMSRSVDEIHKML